MGIATSSRLFLTTSCLRALVDQSRVRVQRRRQPIHLLVPIGVRAHLSRHSVIAAGQTQALVFTTTAPRASRFAAAIAIGLASRHASTTMGALVSMRVATHTMRPRTTHSLCQVPELVCRRSGGYGLASSRRP